MDETKNIYIKKQDRLWKEMGANENKNKKEEESIKMRKKKG